MPTGDTVYEIVGLPTGSQRAFAAAAANYYISPSGSNAATGLSGHPWANWDAYEARIGTAELNGLHTVTLLGDVPRIRTPRIGPNGHLRIVGTPTNLYTGIFTAGTAAEDPGSQAATNLVDSALPLATPYSSWSQIMAQNDFLTIRVRITSGPRAGAVGWALLDFAGGAARASRFSIGAGTPSDHLDIGGPGPTDPEVGDHFVTELLPTISDLYIDPSISGDGTSRTVKLSFWGVRIPLLFSIFPNVLYVSQFLGCDIIGPANINAFGCRLDSVEVTVGTSLIARECGLTSYAYADSGSSVLLQNVIAQGINVIADQNSSLSMNSVGVFDALGPAIWPFHGASVLTFGLVWGTGNSYGWQIDGYGQVARYSVQPTVTGSDGDVVLAGVVKSYAALPVGIWDATLGSGLVPA